MSAGLGTRLKPYTDSEPKALIPVMGIPTAQFSVDALVSAGVKTIVANVHHLAEKAKRGLEHLDQAQAELIVSDESSLLLGSGGGIAKAIPHFRERGAFYWLNADVICDLDLSVLARKHYLLKQRHGVKLTLAVFPAPLGAGKYREVILQSDSPDDVGLVQGLGEVVAGKPYFASVAIIEPELFDGVSGEEPSEFLPRILRPAIEEKKVGYFLTQGQWFDVGSPEVWLETHLSMLEKLETGQLPEKWRKRIEKVNKRIAEKVWISRDSKREFRTANISGPAYFNSLADSTAQPPKTFGPDAVLYGDGSQYLGAFSRAIALRSLISKL